MRVVAYIKVTIFAGTNKCRGDYGGLVQCLGKEFQAKRQPSSFVSHKECDLQA